MTTYTFISALILLVLIMDPVGNIPVFINQLRTVQPERRWKIVIREHVIALAILLLFMMGGDLFLRYMGLSKSSLQISGGVVLFLIAIRMIFPHHADEAAPRVVQEPYIVPLATPMLAGPSAIAVVMLLASGQPDQLWSWLLAVTVAILISAAILLAALRLRDRIDDAIIIAMERLMGLILVALSVEMTVAGIKQALH